jgi:hypothetical protein
MNVRQRSTITKQSVNPTPAVIRLHVIACPPHLSFLLFLTRSLLTLRADL